MHIFAWFGIRKPAGDDQAGFWQQLQKGVVSLGGDLGSGLLMYGLGTRPCTCGPGAELNSSCNNSSSDPFSDNQTPCN